MAELRRGRCALHTSFAELLSDRDELVCPSCRTSCPAHGTSAPQDESAWTMIAAWVLKHYVRIVNLVH